MTKRVYATSKTDVKYPFCFFAQITLQVMPVIYASYILGYINTFVADGPACVCNLPTSLEWQTDSWGDEQQVEVPYDDGSCDDFVSPCTLATGKAASTIHADFILNKTAVALLILPYAGMMADSVEPYIALPIAFAARFMFALLFIFLVNDPAGDWFIFLAISLDASTTFEATIVNALFNRTLPSDIRAGMTSAYTFSGSFFKIFITIAFSKIFDPTVPNNKSVYWGLVICDTILFATSLTLSLTGYLRKPEPKVMPKPKKVLEDSGDEYEDDGFFADTEVKNDEFRMAGPVVFGSKTGSGQAAQLLRNTMMDVAGDTLTGGNKNIYSVAKPKTAPKVLPITDQNVFNC